MPEETELAMGRGSMTGRGLGVCSGADVGGSGAGMGRGYGAGMGGGLVTLWSLSGCRRIWPETEPARGCRRGFGGFFTQSSWHCGQRDADRRTAAKRPDEINKQLENE